MDHNFPVIIISLNHYSMDKDGGNAKILDARRAEMNLPPEAAYIERFRKSFPKGC